MATILRGKRKGEVVELQQGCNDWFMLPDGTILHPSSLRLTPEEVKTVRGWDTGEMFELYELREDGTFRWRAR